MTDDESVARTFGWLWADWIFTMVLISIGGLAVAVPWVAGLRWVAATVAASEGVLVGKFVMGVVLLVSIPPGTVAVLFTCSLLVEYVPLPTLFDDRHF